MSIRNEPCHQHQECVGRKRKISTRDFHYIHVSFSRCTQTQRPYIHTSTRRAWKATCACSSLNTFSLHNFGPITYCFCYAQEVVWLCSVHRPTSWVRPPWQHTIWTNICNLLSYKHIDRHAHIMRSRRIGSRIELSDVFFFVFTYELVRWARRYGDKHCLHV